MSRQHQATLASYVTSVFITASQFVTAWFPQGTASAIVVTLPLSVIPILLALYGRSTKAVIIGLLAGLSPILLLWLAYVVAFLLYIVSFGHIALI